MNITSELARFVAETTYEDIPQRVIQNQKKSIMDAVAITLGASTLGDGCGEMVDIAKRLAAGGKEEASVIGFGMKLPVHWAAFANASMAHSLDFGDTHQQSTIHSNSASFPAALAVAEGMRGIDGKKFLTALVIGSEVAIRIALAADVNTSEYGFYIPTIYSSYGATAAVAKLMGLTQEQIISAFSFNLCQTMCSSELINNKKTVVRSVREAFSARNAIVACFMAKENLAGFEDPLEGSLGFYHTFLHNQYTCEKALDGLGVTWRAEELTYKAWPCCFGTHAPITGALDIIKEQQLVSDDILHIQISTGAQNKMLFEPLAQRRNPDTAILGKFSIPFTAATAIIYGDVTIDSFSQERLHDEKIRSLAGKIDYTYREDWQRGCETWANIVIESKKGVFTRMITSPYGTPANPMPDEAFEKKFDSCAAKAFKPKTAPELEQLKKAIAEIDSLPDISDFAALL